MVSCLLRCVLFASFTFFFFNDTATPEIYPLSLPDALPILARDPVQVVAADAQEHAGRRLLEGPQRGRYSPPGLAQADLEENLGLPRPRQSGQHVLDVRSQIGRAHV